MRITQVSQTVHKSSYDTAVACLTSGYIYCKHCTRITWNERVTERLRLFVCSYVSPPKLLKGFRCTLEVVRVTLLLLRIGTILNLLHYLKLYRNTYCTCIPIARQRVAKHVTAEANAWNNRTFIARLRRGKQDLSIIQTVFSVGSVQIGYKRVEFRTWQFSSVELSVQLWSVNQRTTEADEFPLLRFLTTKHLVKTRQRNSHCGELLPGKG
jgi:hypothetical protein